MATSSTTAETASAPAGDQSAARPSVNGGPATHVTSATAASTANAERTAPGSAITDGSTARMHEPTGGVTSPIATANAISAAVGAPDGSAASASRSAAASTLVVHSTVVCPRRSTRRAASGPPMPSATA